MSEDNIENVVPDFIITTIILLMSLGLFVIAFNYTSLRTGSSDPGGAVWPQLILIVIIVLTVSNLGRMTYKQGLSKIIGTIVRNMQDLFLGTYIDNKKIRQTYSTVGFMIAYLLILNPVGFLPSTVVYMLFQVSALGYGSLLKNFVFSTGSTMLIFILFKNFMNISLPLGTGPFRVIGVFVDGLI